MINYILDFLKQILFTDIFTRINKIQEQNMILRNRLKRIDKKQIKKIKVNFRRNRN